MSSPPSPRSPFEFERALFTTGLNDARLGTGPAPRNNPDTTGQGQLRSWSEENSRGPERDAAANAQLTEWTSYEANSQHSDTLGKNPNHFLEIPGPGEHASRARLNELHAEYTLAEIRGRDGRAAYDAFAPVIWTESHARFGNDPA
jgi:hypothetical protein